LDKLPNIAVLLAAYNGEQYIQEQLDSILAQKSVKLSIFVSVDKCKDSTFSIVKGYELEHPDIITVLSYGESFGSAGKNFTRLLCDVDFTSYQYISFADQDDVWLTHKLKRAVSEINKNNADAYSSNVTAFWESGKKKIVKKDYPQVEFDYLFESPGPGCSFLLKSNLANALQAHLSEKLAEGDVIWLHDWYCYSFARYNGLSWCIDSEPMMLYRQHELNVVGANSGWKGFISRFKTIMDGDGFNKVLKQAHFIGQETSLPIKLIRMNNRFSMLRLFYIGWKCRRQPSHKVLFSIACLIFFIKGFAYNETD